jgi:hypothetical protein
MHKGKCVYWFFYTEVRLLVLHYYLFTSFIISLLFLMELRIASALPLDPCSQPFRLYYILNSLVLMLGLVSDQDLSISAS